MGENGRQRGLSDGFRLGREAMREKAAAIAEFDEINWRGGDDRAAIAAEIRAACVPEPESPSIDYRDLLRRYVQFVERKCGPFIAASTMTCAGLRASASEVGVALTDVDWAELRRLAEEG